MRHAGQAYANVAAATATTCKQSRVSISMDAEIADGIAIHGKPNHVSFVKTAVNGKKATLKGRI
jgi:hypothetical protein